MRRSLVRARLAGVPSPFGQAELAALVAAVVAGGSGATLGLDLAGLDHAGPGVGGTGPPSRDEVWAAWSEGWGWDAPAGGVSIDVARTIAAADRAADQLAAVCAAGGSVALATGRPASLLWCYQEIARRLTAAGARVLRSGAAAGSMDAGSARFPRSVWWLGGVAVVTDGQSIRADDGIGIADDWLFGVGRPDLVVADRGFAGAAASCGHPTVAFTDLDAVALEVAARRGAPITALPLGCGRPPEAYAPVVGLLTARLGEVEAHPDLAHPDLAHPALGGERPPHSTTPTPGAYAAPESGGEG